MTVLSSSLRRMKRYAAEPVNLEVLTSVQEELKYKLISVQSDERGSHSNSLTEQAKFHCFYFVLYFINIFNINCYKIVKLQHHSGIHTLY
jgi:hypothetical protein